MAKKMWQVRLVGPGGSTRTDHPSKSGAYRDAVAERLKAERGETEVTAIRVLQRSESVEGWSLYERISIDRVG